MGLLVNGIWKDKWYDTDSNKGKFVRSETQFRSFIGEDKAFQPEKKRYHLYLSYACPWAHRTLIFWVLKKLKGFIGITVVHPAMLEQGWELKDENGCSTDPLYGYSYLYQLYTKAEPEYSGRVTVPILWDKKTESIVNNESSEIIRMFNFAFNKITGDTQDFYPTSLRNEIDEINDMVYRHINNGVYQCGFATTQAAYEDAFNQLFNSLNEIEERLNKQAYLAGERLTEADWRLFTTLIRFDAVYYGHFKTNLKRIKDYPNLYRYLKKLYHYPGIAETVHFDHIKRHYYYSHKMINPSQIIPVGPEVNL